MAIWKVTTHQPFLAMVEMVHILGARSPYSSHMATPLPALAASEGDINKMKRGETNTGDRDGSEDSGRAISGLQRVSGLSVSRHSCRKELLHTNKANGQNLSLVSSLLLTTFVTSVQ